VEEQRLGGVQRRQPLAMPVLMHDIARLPL
jgi:hypothetical protein